MSADEKNLRSFLHARREQPEGSREGEGELYSLEEKDGVLVICFGVAKFSKSAEIGRMGDSLRKRIARVEKPRVVIDLTGLEFAVSSFLGELIHTREKVDAAGGEFAVCGAKGSVLEVMRLMRLDEMFNIQASREKAIAVVRE